MKKSLVTVLTQISLIAYSASVEVDNILVCCKTTVQDTQFERLAMPMLCHITITNNNAAPCLIDTSLIIKNKLYHETLLKNDIRDFLCKKNRLFSTIYGCSSCIAGCLSLIALCKFCIFYSAWNASANEQTLINLTGSMPGLNSFAQSSNENCGPTLSVIDWIMMANTFMSPLALCMVTAFLAKQHANESLDSGRTYLDYITLSQTAPIILHPGASVEKVFALEDPSESIVINGDAIQTKKNFWGEMTNFFSKKK